MTMIKVPYALMLLALIVIVGIAVWSPDYSSESSRIDFQRSRMYVIFGAYAVLLGAVWWLTKSRAQEASTASKKISWFKVLIGAFGIGGGVMLLSMMIALAFRGVDGMDLVFNSMPIIVLAGFLAGIPICLRWIK